MASIAKAAKASNTPSVPRPSASILLISPTNQILLLHRVQTSSSFPSAHVFPGGNISPEQDGDVPDSKSADRHEDSLVYRMGAIRECFEESGILLAKKLSNPGALLEVNDAKRDEARHAIHDNKAKFQEWVQSQHGLPDTEGLIPFTRWITPTNIPKRFTTQMYIHFLPLPNTPSASTAQPLPTDSEAMIADPTSDGGIEHTTARFLPPSKWLEMSRAGEIILFPPQFLLLHLLAPFLSPENVPATTDPAELARQRQRVVEFVNSGDPPWTQKCISPIGLLWKQGDGRAVLGLDKPGVELEGSNRRGDDERVVLVDFRKEGPRKVEVKWKRDVFREERDGRGKL
ncbi:hypothetical protein MMC13_004933 [Lambiella insularis]|nr:hypothetical protein [Lambiella insularis]